jgi:hypothetical protein
MEPITTAVHLSVLALAAARVTALLVDDAVLEAPRGRLLARLVNRPYLTTLVTCPRCLGFWIAAAWTLAWLRWPDGTVRWAATWAVASLALRCYPPSPRGVGDDD